MEFLQDVGAKLSDSRVLVTAVLQAKQGWGGGGGGVLFKWAHNKLDGIFSAK